MNLIYIIFIAILLLPIGMVQATEVDSVANPAFTALQAAQNRPLQKLLDSLYVEDSGYIVGGPLDYQFQGDSISEYLFQSVRVICPSIGSVEDAFALLKSCSTVTVERWISHLHMGRQEPPLGYRGILAVVQFQGKTAYIQFNTIQETRWLIWAHDALFQDSSRTISLAQWGGYARAVSEYLYGLDQKWPALTAPKAGTFGLPDSMDFYPPIPSPVIASMEEYDGLLRSHNAITTAFARGIEAFYPSDSLVKALEFNAPANVYCNKNAGSFQLECSGFFQHEGDLKEIKTLTRRLFDSLGAGEYRYVVGLSGKIRIVKVPAPGEMERYERMKRHKMPVPAESFFFPGEAVLGAGRFVLARDSVPYIAEINIRSDHFLQSQFSPAAKDEIAQKSNDDLLSLGHFYRALALARIVTRPILIRKF